ncbi:MAG TPA: hypothetical protein VMF52_06880 [Steroidobacteraceae bacterium]|nr:hypothetical protein [Steroidobacteraceae bacterium]
MLYLHVVAGSVGILFGFVTMFFAKGSPRHRWAGNVYTVAMLVMTGSAFIAAIFLKPNKLNVLAAMLTGYLVGTAWLTVRRKPEAPRALEFVAMGVAAAAALFGFFVVGTAPGTGMTGFGLFFGGIAALCLASDLRFWSTGAMSRAQRLTRHLWRMGVSFAIASGSLFLGQMKHLPAWLTGSKLNVVLALTPLVLTVFWLIRVRLPPWSRKARAGGQPPLTAAP